MDKHPLPLATRVQPPSGPGGGVSFQEWKDFPQSAFPQRGEEDQELCEEKEAACLCTAVSLVAGTWQVLIFSDA